jgi:5-oxoprolinase (ATP-hydrolysing) subunit C
MTSLQDAGRVGWRRHGVSTSGAMDRLALAAANVLVGNAPDAAAIELMLLGGTFRIEGGAARLAVAGAPCAVTVDGEAVPESATLTLRDGQTLAVGTARSGVYAYLAAAGRFALAPQLGSLSLHARARIGGLHGRPLRPGDRLPLGPAPALDRDLALEPVPLAPDAPVRVVLGPQADHFTAAALAAFASSTYVVSGAADRMGYRLNGPRLEHAAGYNIVSDGVVAGSVQVPGTGEPIVMMADCQTTGGYPKIATVISADLRVIAQRRPGAAVRFEAVEIAQAQQIARERADVIAGLCSRTQPRAASLRATEELLTMNLAGSAVDALAPDALVPEP